MAVMALISMFAWRGHIGITTYKEINIIPKI
jgi:hypothetical protein